MKVPDWAKKTVAAPGHPLPEEPQEPIEDAVPVEPVEPPEQKTARKAPPVTPPASEDQHQPEPVPVDDLAEEEDLDIVEEIEEPEDEIETEIEDEVEEAMEDEDFDVEEEDVEDEDIEEEPEDEIDEAEDELEADVEDIEEEVEDEIEDEDDFDIEEEDIDDEDVEEELEEELDESEDELEADVEDVDESQEELGDEVEADVEDVEYLEEEESEPVEAVGTSVFIEEVAQQLADEEIGPRYEVSRQEQQPGARSRAWSMATAPIFKIAGDRIRLSVNFVTAGVIVLIIFTLLLAAYVIGKKTASPSGQDTSAASVGQTVPGQDKPALPGSEAEVLKIPDGPVEAAPGHRDPKRYYLVIETLKGATSEDYDDAEEIINFCAARGLPAEMVNINGRFAVWCLLGFKSRISDAALEHTRTVERVGEEYFAKKKTYMFMQRNKKGGELRPFFKRGAYRK